MMRPGSEKVADRTLHYIQAVFMSSSSSLVTIPQSIATTRDLNHDQVYRLQRQGSVPTRMPNMQEVSFGVCVKASVGHG